VIYSGRIQIIVSEMLVLPFYSLVHDSVFCDWQELIRWGHIIWTRGYLELSVSLRVGFYWLEKFTKPQLQNFRTDVYSEQRSSLIVYA